MRYPNVDDLINIINSNLTGTFKNILNEIQKEQDVIEEGIKKVSRQQASVTNVKNVFTMTINGLSHLKTRFSNKNKEIANIINQYRLNNENNNSNLQELFYSKILDVSKVRLDDYWKIILDLIFLYREEKIKLTSELGNLLTFNELDSEIIKNKLHELKAWEIEHPDPVKDLADNCLDLILNKFHKKTSTKFEFENLEKLKNIEIENYNGRTDVVPFDKLSSGEKRIILSGLPLYTLKPKSSIILFDEPENSFYPDIQYRLVNYYTNELTKPEDNNQFFFATHSPIIASAFEPWEIVELKFGEDGYVYRDLDPWLAADKRHLSVGETRVEDWVVDPRYLNWADIFTRVFELPQAGRENYEETLDKLFALELQLKKLGAKKEKTKTEIDDFQSKLKEYTTLSRKIKAKVDLSKMPQDKKYHEEN